MTDKGIRMVGEAVKSFDANSLMVARSSSVKSYIEHFSQLSKHAHKLAIIVDYHNKT